METLIKKMTCKKCNKGTLGRVRRPLLIKALTLGLPIIKKYQCNYCRNKTYVFDQFGFSFKQKDLQML